MGLQDLIYRSALAIVLAAGTVDVIVTIRRAPLLFAASPGFRLPLARAVRSRRVWVVITAFAAAAIAFAVDLAPVVPGTAMAIIFLACTSTYLALDATGYFVETDDGKVTRHVFHHLHLAGLCAIAAVVAEVVAVCLGEASPSSRNGLMVHAVWAVIGAHYFLAGCAKVSSRGLAWVDIRLLPLYTTLLGTYELGDTGRFDGHRLMGAISTRPRVARVMLASALATELAAIAYPLTALTRLVVGTGIVGLHVFTRRVMNISFRESLALVVVFSFPVARWVAS